MGIAGKTGMAGDIHLHWTLGEDSTESKLLKKKFIPFFSAKAKKIEIIENKRKKIVSSIYFKEREKYTSSNS